MTVTVHHYLHECATGVVRAKRIDDKTIKFTLDDGNMYAMSHDHRDRRALVVFDGELLFGGLPKNAQIICYESLGAIYRNHADIRKNVGYPCVALPKYQYDDDHTGIELFRYFILLPSCHAIVRKYRQRNLSPIYVTIRVFNGKNDNKVVEWLTTSF